MRTRSVEEIQRMFEEMGLGTEEDRQKFSKLYEESIAGKKSNLLFIENDNVTSEVKKNAKLAGYSE